MGFFKPKAPRSGTANRRPGEVEKKGKATCLMCKHEGSHAMNCPVIRDATRDIRNKRKG